MEHKENCGVIALLSEKNLISQMHANDGAQQIFTFTFLELVAAANKKGKKKKEKRLTFKHYVLCDRGQFHFGSVTKKVTQ